MSEFGKAIAEAYAVDGAPIDLGRGVHDGALAPEAVVQMGAREQLAARLEEAEPEPAGSGVGGTRRRRSGPAEEARRISKRRRKDAATATTGGVDVLGDFLRSREGKALGRKVARGVFGMLRKRL